MFQKFSLPLLHADGIDDRFALHTFQSRFDDRPFGRIDHDWHTGDVGFGGDEIEETHHHLFPIQQAIVHVDVDDLRPIFDLLTGDF